MSFKANKCCDTLGSSSKLILGFFNSHSNSLVLSTACLNLFMALIFNLSKKVRIYLLKVRKMVCFYPKIWSEKSQNFWHFSQNSIVGALKLYQIVWCSLPSNSNIISLNTVHVLLWMLCYCNLSTSRLLVILKPLVTLQSAKQRRRAK